MDADSGIDRRLERMLAPESIAIVGASAEEGKRGNVAMERLLAGEFDGSVHPVNPTYEGDILGRTVYPNVSAIPEKIDLIYVVTPASVVADVLRDAGEAGVAGAVIFAAGFSEVGADGREQELVEMAEETGIRFLGPNVMGLVNTHADVYLGIDAEYDAGRIAVISQSGNLGMTLGGLANSRRNTGVSQFVSIGNEADVSFDELLDYYAEDSETEAVIIYAEGMAEGRACLRAAKRVAADMPIIVLKGGRTEAGKSSAASHTASLAGDAAVTEAVYRQAGITLAPDFDSLLPLAETLIDAPPLSGRNLAIMTEAGGVATIAADGLVEAGFTVPKLAETTQERLQELFPTSPNVTNPIDTMVTPETAAKHAEAAAIVLEDEHIDGLLLCGAYGGYGHGGAGIELPTDPDSAAAQLESARRLPEIVEETGKPIIIKSAYDPMETESLAICRDNGIPVFQDFRMPPLVFDALAQRGRFLEAGETWTDFVPSPARKADPRIATAKEESRAWLDEQEARTLLSTYDIPFAPSKLVRTPGAAAEAVREFDGPVAMKVVSPHIQHKSDIGGVALNVTGEGAARETFEELQQVGERAVDDGTITGILVSPMVDSGTEVIIGGLVDPEVGPVVMVGLGGVFVEVLDDIAFGAVPVTNADAKRMLDDLAAVPVLEGERGEPGVDTKSLVKVIRGVSAAMEANPDIVELDLNPVICTPNNAVALDAVIRLQSDQS